MKRLVWILVSVLAFAPATWANAGDIQLPQLGQAGGNVVTPEQLDEIGRQALMELRRDGLILDDPLTTDYIRDVGHRIASYSDRPDLPIHYYVMRDPSINSFAMPGGNVFIFTGLLLATDNENELAGVIAHETAHVTQHHVARAIADSESLSAKALLGMLAGVLIGMRSGNPQVAEAAIMGTQAALIQHQINFTRHDESEADRVGIGFMAHAGYDPRGMAQMFQKFEILSRGQIAPPAFLVDHPLDTQRITDAKERAQQMHPRPHANSRNYLLMRARARVLVADHIDDALTYFKNVDMSKLTPMAADAIRYGEALCYIRLNRESKAIAILKPLLAAHQDVVAFHIALANAEFQNGERAAALARFEQTERIFPGSLAVEVAHANALLDAGKADAARHLLQAAALENSSDPSILRLLADATSRSGRTAEGRYYLSQFYELNGQIASAIDQMRLALDAPHIDVYEKQRYQARLDDLRHTMRDLRRDRNGNGPRLGWRLESDLPDRR